MSGVVNCGEMTLSPPLPQSLSRRILDIHHSQMPLIEDQEWVQTLVTHSVDPAIVISNRKLRVSFPSLRLVQIHRRENPVFVQ